MHTALAPPDTGICTTTSHRIPQLPLITLRKVFVRLFVLFFRKRLYKFKFRKADVTDVFHKREKNICALACITGNNKRGISGSLVAGSLFVPGCLKIEHFGLDTKDLWSECGCVGNCSMI